MKTIEQFLTSDEYKHIIADLVQLKPKVKFVEHADYEAPILMEAFQERCYVLEGSEGNVPTEEECVQWIREQIAEDWKEIMSYVVARLTFSEELDDDSTENLHRVRNWTQAIGLR